MGMVGSQNGQMDQENMSALMKLAGML